METRDIWEEVFRRFGKKNSTMNVTDFFAGDRFALFIDLSSTRDNDLHGSGSRLLAIKRRAWGSGNVKYHIFILSDAQLNIINCELEKEQIKSHQDFFARRNNIDADPVE
ncbi:hypothetical protein pdam_00013018 [Pocillopora damicornis]|uniref:Uncharacterized protein n=1 Tax=Pocillopora damicornis TaxID=46731 RepID=A0A3M6U5M3_POCDA|nr:hypothetical protein pdam_00013018 [Pocillopora damicornis]